MVGALPSVAASSFPAFASSAALQYYDLSYKSLQSRSRFANRGFMEHAAEAPRPGLRQLPVDLSTGCRVVSAARSRPPSEQGLASQFRLARPAVSSGIA